MQSKLTKPTSSPKKKTGWRAPGAPVLDPPLLTKNSGLASKLLKIKCSPLYLKFTDCHFTVSLSYQYKTK